MAFLVSKQLTLLNQGSQVDSISYKGTRVLWDNNSNSKMMGSVASRAQAPITNLLLIPKALLVFLICSTLTNCISKETINLVTSMPLLTLWVNSASSEAVGASNNSSSNSLTRCRAVVSKAHTPCHIQACNSNNNSNSSSNQVSLTRNTSSTTSTSSSQTSASSSNNNLSWEETSTFQMQLDLEPSHKGMANNSQCITSSNQ